MEMILCPNCGKLTGFKRALGFGTFFAVLITAGLWFLAIPFYPKRCITCGLGKSEAIPWYRTWRLATVLLAGVGLVVVLVDSFFAVSGSHSEERTKIPIGGEPVTTHAASPRDDWKRAYFNLDGHLDHTLADAQFTAEERARILQVIEKFAIDEKERVERKTLMSARVGSVGLAQDGSQQVLVQGPYLAFCGSSGNCPMWIFMVDRSGQFRLVSEMFGNAIILRDTFSRGFRDFATSWHMSAYEEDISVYRWNGAKYEQTDCYSATTDSDRSDSPVIADCHR